MISNVLINIKDKLNSYFSKITSSNINQVNFLDGNKMDPLVFPNNSVVPILVNIEEEVIIRQAHRRGQFVQSGVRTGLAPAIGINVTVMFVSSFSDYDQSLQFLSLIISYFQQYPFLDQSNTPTLPDTVEKIQIELISMPLSQRNELWTSLKTTYRPSVVYKLGVLMFYDNTEVTLPPQIEKGKVKIETTQM